jgi:hypothetical protein
MIVMLCQVRSGYDRLGKVISIYVRFVQVS